MGHGRKDLYSLYLQRELGTGIVEELHRRAGKSKVWTKSELQEIAEERQKQIQELK